MTRPSSPADPSSYGPAVPGATASEDPAPDAAKSASAGTSATGVPPSATAADAPPTVPPADDLGLLLDVLPARVRDELRRHPDRDDLVEVVLDLGRTPEARFPERGVLLGEDGDVVTRQDLEHVVGRVGRFGRDNRAGIERTLHRISAIRNREGATVGVTCRVGRAVMGTVQILRDVIEEGWSILLLGRPGVGKTTLLREAARVLADDLGKRAVIVDTSNEIAGDGDVPHPGIGRARRMQVPTSIAQADVMIEAVENHMPEVIVIDEIGTQEEAAAARTIAERGVQLIATAHGNTLENLLQNPTLSDLIGGIQAVTLSDEEARRRGTQKTVLERKAPPTFDVLVEIQDKESLAVHRRVSEVVDRFLRGVPPRPERRVRTGDGGVEITRPEPEEEGFGVGTAAWGGSGGWSGGRGGGSARVARRRERRAARHGGESYAAGYGGSGRAGSGPGGGPGGGSSRYGGGYGRGGDDERGGDEGRHGGDGRGEAPGRAGRPGGGGWQGPGAGAGSRGAASPSAGPSGAVSSGAMHSSAAVADRIASPERPAAETGGEKAAGGSATGEVAAGEATARVDSRGAGSAAGGGGGVPEAWEARDADLARWPGAAGPAAPSGGGAAGIGGPVAPGRPSRILRVFPYAVSRSRLERAVRKFGVPAYVVQDLSQADVILTTKGQERRQPRRLRDAQARGVPLHLVKSNTVTQMESFLRVAFGLGGGRGAGWEGERDEEADALQEAEDGVGRALDEGQPVELAPRVPYLRRLQHELAQRHHLDSESHGDEPFRRVVLYPP